MASEMAGDGVPVVHKGSVYDNPGTGTAGDYGAVYGESGMSLKEQLKGSVYNSSGMALAVDYGAAYGDSGMSLKDQMKVSVYNSSGMALAVDYGAAYGDSGMSLKDQMKGSVYNSSVYDNSGMPPPADKGSYYNMFAHEPDVTAGEALPFTEQVFADKAVAAVGRDKVAGAFTERVRRFLPVVGTATASLAVTGLAAGTATPAVGFALVTLLLVGLSLVTIGVSQLG